ncbi:MAG: UDP-3-O-(3-hydroxymyristoyl)glucosamine N-acyltransferase [Gammaproteobacteria bacterium]|nr:UDP-3-O-(3-hydroxymyristoyl)glucosamine N-acyltransferase [Gammaproteobacteria bacterium]
MDYTLGEIAQRIGARLVGEAGTRISGVTSLESSRANAIGFLTHPRYRKLLIATRAAAVILREEELPYCPVAALVCDNPYAAYARATALFAPAPVEGPPIHPTAVIDATARLAQGVRVAAHAVVEAGVELGAGVAIGSGCVVGEGVRIGAGSRLYPNVTVYHGCEIGRNVIIHSGAVIGADGFGFANEAGRWIKIHQLGRVVIGDEVEIGANTTIDRGAIEDTVIGHNVIIDNQVQVAHNVRIGDHTAIAGCVGIAGSAVIGSHCALGGGAGILGHLELGDGVTVTAMSLVTNSIPHSGVYSAGTPLEPKAQWQKNYVRFKQLDEMAHRLRTLEKEFKQLTKEG